MKSFFIIFTLLALLAPVHLLRAQAPQWAVNASDYQYSMTVTAFLNVNGTTLATEQDMVGAFVGDQLRGTAQLMYVENADRYLAFLTIYANSVGEVVSFKIYNSSTDAVVPVDKTLAFSLDEQFGNTFQAYSIAQPTLSSEAAITDFTFAQVYTVSSDITESEVKIVVDQEQDLSSLVAEYILSAGARLYLGRELQTTATEARDFSAPLVYTVLSEDESVLRSYQVSVTHDAAGTSEFMATNVVTANNDGHNDYWVVQQADRYYNHSFTIFDANGRVLLSSVGYQNTWNGYFEGRRLNKGKYYFKIVSPDQQSTITGDILLIY